MKKVLFICDFFKPGYKAGGPIQSIYNLCLLIGKMASIRVITQDHDIDKTVYDLPKESWIDKKLYQVKYLKTSKYLKSYFMKTDAEIIYLNSFFSVSTQLFFLFRSLPFMGKNKNIDIIVAPRGEFDPGALMIKSKKKSIFLYFFKLIKINMLTFHATTTIELQNIQSVFGRMYPIKVAANVPKPASHFNSLKKNTNFSEFYFLSRISPKKNLKYAICLFNKLQLDGNLNFKIIGPIEDTNYWEECQELIANLPANINCTYVGEISNDLISEVLKNSHYFLFPTLGENYGHVIYESLALGKPILISDQTPWDSKNYENGVFAYPLSEEKKFLDTIKELHILNNESYYALSKNAYQYSLRSADFEQITNDYTKLFKL